MNGAPATGALPRLPEPGPGVFLDPQRAERLLAHVREKHPFYRRWLAGRETVPILDRATVCAENEALLNGHPARARTSGSTGMPVRIAYSRRRVEVEREWEERTRDWTTGPGPTVVLAYGRKNDPLTLDVHAPPGEQVGFLETVARERGATGVVTYPTNARLLAEHLAAAGRDLPGWRRFGLVGEHVDPDLPGLLAGAFPGAAVWKHYASMEVGVIAIQCPDDPDHYHLLTDKLGVEILDEDGRPCGPGRLGRVVLTDYANTAMPFLRYEIGDLAAWAPVSCAHAARPALTMVCGKTRGTLVREDGARIPFIDLSVALRDLPGMRQYQVEQTARDRVLVRVAAERDLAGPIGELVRAALGPGVAVDVLPVTTIPREPGGKFLAARCRV